MAWGFKTPVTIDHTKVAADATAFTVLVSFTSTTIRDSITDPTGVDIAFDGAGTGAALYTYKRILWNNTTGEGLFAVVVDLSASVDPVLYLLDTNSGFADASSANAHPANCSAASYGSLTDHSRSAADFTVTGSLTTGAGRFGNALSGFSTSNYMQRSASVPTAGAIYISALFKQSTLATGAIGGRSISGSNAWVDELGVNGAAGSMRSTTLGNNASSATGLLAANTWTYAVARNPTGNSNYIGVAKTWSAQATAAETNAGTPNRLNVGIRDVATLNNPGTGVTLNVLRVYDNTAGDPGQNYFDTEANSFDPATFMSFGSRTAVSSNNAPTASITAPSTGSSVARGASVTFTGSGSDTEDGALTGASLVWVSDLDGQIGTGTSFATTALSGGVHTITLTATDSGSLTGTATITLTVTTTGRAEVLALIAATGGDANWNAAYEPSFNATMVSAAVSQLADVRGTGFGKALAQGTAGSRPTRATDANGRTVMRCASASTQHLVSATVDAAIDLSLATPTYVIVIARTSTTGGPAFGVAADPTTTATYPYAVVETQSGNVGAAGAPTSAAVLAPNTGLAAADGVARLGVWGKARTHVTTGVGTSAPGNPHWRLHGSGRMAQEFDSTSGASILPAATAGGLKPVLGRLGSSYFDGDVLFAGVFIGDISAAYLETLRQFAEARGAVLDVSKRAAPIWMGNSLTVGHNASDRYTYVAGSGTSSPAYGTITAVTTLPAWTSRFDIPADLLRTNLFGVAGQNLSDIDQAFPLRFAPLRDARRPGRQWYELWEITNQIVSIGSSASAILALIASIRTQVLVAGGAGLIVGTTIDRGNYYTSGVGVGGLNTFGTIAQSVNTSLRSGLGTYHDGLIDYEADSQFTIGSGACASTTIYRAASADFTHLTDAGYAAIGAIRRAFYDANDAALFGGGLLTLLRQTIIGTMM